MTFDKFFYIKIREKKLKILSSLKPIQKIRDNCFHFQYLENMNLKCLSAEIYVPISLEFIFFFPSQKSCVAFFQESHLFRLEFEAGQ